MATLSFSCPQCGKLHERVKSGMVGFKVKCKCGFIFRLGSKEDKNEEFGDIIRKKREMKRKAAEAAQLNRSNREQAAFDLLPKFDPFDPNREDAPSPSNEIQSPISEGVISASDESVELEAFHLPPPIPDDDPSLMVAQPGTSGDLRSGPPGVAVGLTELSRSEEKESRAVAGQIPDELLDSIDSGLPEEPIPLPGSGVIREQKKLVQGRPKKQAKSNGSSSFLLSLAGLILSMILGPIYVFGFGYRFLISGAYAAAAVAAENSADAAVLVSLPATLHVTNMVVCFVLSSTLLLTFVLAIVEMVKSQLYFWPWMIQGGAAAIGLILACAQVGFYFQAGSSFLYILIQLVVMVLPPLVITANSIARLIARS